MIYGAKTWTTKVAKNMKWRERQTTIRAALNDPETKISRKIKLKNVENRQKQHYFR